MGSVAVMYVEESLPVAHRMVEVVVLLCMYAWIIKRLKVKR
jgi:hypothetical protein